MPIKLVSEYARQFAGMEAEIGLLAAAMLPEIEAMSFVQAYSVPGKEITIRMILGGGEEAAAWDVEPVSCGFFCVCSARREDEETEEGYFEVCEDFVVHVNLETLAAAVVAEHDWDADTPALRMCGISSALTTVPHELRHALEWIRQTGGLTPMEVFDTGDGELSLRGTLDAMQERFGGADAEEDAIEAWASGIADSVLPPIVPLAEMTLGEISDRGPRPGSI